MASWKKWLLTIGGFIMIMWMIQMVPYGKQQSNPPILSEIQWNTPKTRVLFYKSCKNCHTNETEWPWYSKLAPASWLIQYDVTEGRAGFNVSEWIPGRAVNNGKKAAKEVKEGEMPPWYYLPAHPAAWLNKDEKADLISGLIATFGEDKE